MIEPRGKSFQLHRAGWPPFIVLDTATIFRGSRVGVEDHALYGATEGAGPTRRPSQAWEARKDPPFAEPRSLCAHVLQGVAPALYLHGPDCCPQLLEDLGWLGMCAVLPWPAAAPHVCAKQLQECVV